MLYGVEQTVTYIAWDTSANAGKTGDSANHTLRWVKNGTSAAPTNTPSEVDATNAPGLYKITLTATEWETLQGTLAGKSSTANVSVIPQQFTTVRGPNAAPGASGGLPILGTGTGAINPSGGKLPATLAAADVSGNLPADAKAWNGGSLPTIGTSNYDGTDTTGTTTLLERLSAARSGYLDNLNVGGLVASQADIAGITQAQRVRVLPPSLMERPDSDSLAYRVWIYVYNEQHQAEDLDSAPTVTAENNAGTDRSSNLGTVTKPGGTTGQYYVDYTVASDHAIEQLVFKVAATEGTVTTNYAAPSIVVATTAVDFTATDRSNLEAIKNKLPSKGYLTGTNNSDGDVQLDEATGTVARVTLVDTCTTNSDMRGTDGANMVAPDNAGIAAIKAKTDNLPVQPASQGSVDAIATILAGITSLAKWLRAFVRKDTPDSTALSEINSGGGAYSAATDSQEAIRDRGDAAWITGAGGSAGAVYVLPLQSTPSNSGRLPETYLTAYQGCKFQATFAVTDRGNTPVDLTGYDLDFVTWLKTTPGTPVLTLSSTGATPALTISGEGNNQVTIDAAATSTPTAGQYEWRLYGDGEIALATGTLKIEAGAMPPTGG